MYDQQAEQRYGVESELQPRIPYWNVNVPQDKWSVQCPDFLADVDDYDRAQLAVKDHDYDVMTWSEVKNIIKTNHLELFKRVPSDLRRYREHMAKLKKDHGSIMNYLLKERVQWQDLIPKAGPFIDPDDIRILANDWPYGIDPKIVHLVVWVKFDLEEDPDTGDLTSETRKQINHFVNATFRNTANSDHIVWFKNWTALKSVHAVEHFHVMLYNPDPLSLRRIINADVAVSQAVLKSSICLPGTDV